VFVSIKPLHVSAFFHNHLQGVLRCALCRYYPSRWFAFVESVLLHSMWPHVYVICACLVFLSASDLLVNCLTVIGSYYSETKRKIIQCQNFDIDEQIFAITILLGRDGLKILLIWSCLLQDCKRGCPVITSPTDAFWPPVPVANNSYRSSSYGVTDIDTKCLLLQMYTLCYWYWH
jgi:hypothetical protein